MGRVEGKGHLGASCLRDRKDEAHFQEGEAEQEECEEGGGSAGCASAAGPEGEVSD